MADKWEDAAAAIEIVKGKWTMTVLAAVDERPRSHNELVRCTGLENKQLERTLRRLVENGVVAQEFHGRNNRRVSYRLTLAGARLCNALDQLAYWRRRELAAVPSGMKSA